MFLTYVFDGESPDSEHLTIEKAVTVDRVCLCLK